VRTAAAGLAVPDGSDVAVVTELPDEPAIVTTVTADPTALRRIVDNLARNALQSLPERGGTVTLTVRPEGDGDEPAVVLEVADSGDGIAPENLHRIFDDFFTTRPGGSGLGLSNVRRLAADCGAAVTVASEPGRGSRFSVRFPAPTDRPEPTTTTPDPERTV
jgi:signal transduction histidine kinase